MKKVFTVLSFVILSLCCVACSRSDKGTTEDSSMVDAEAEESTFDYRLGMHYAERHQLMSLSEAGIIYDDDNRGIVRLVTIDEGDDMPFCYNPNCTHPDVKTTGGDPECMAALYEGIMCKTAYYNGVLYFFVGDGVFAHKVYAMDTNGSGRKLLAKLPFFYTNGYFCIFKDDKVYYTAKIPYSDEITNTGGYKHRVVELSLVDGSYRFITEETEDILTQANISGDTMYIRKSDADNKGRLYLEMVNIKTLESRVVITMDEWMEGSHRYVDAYDADSYYYWNMNTADLGIMNVDGTVEKILLKGAEGEGYGWAYPSCDGLFYQREKAYEDEPEGYYFLDMNTMEVTNITEEGIKYNLQGYDGYYGAFWGYDGEFNYSMWSEEKILGEARARQ